MTSPYRTWPWASGGPEQDYIAALCERDFHLASLLFSRLPYRERTPRLRGVDPRAFRRAHVEFVWRPSLFERVMEFWPFELDLLGAWSIRVAERPVIFGFAGDDLLAPDLSTLERDALRVNGFWLW